jgi:hypothetical protein
MRDLSPMLDEVVLRINLQLVCAYPHSHTLAAKYIHQVMEGSLERKDIKHSDYFSGTSYTTLEASSFIKGESQSTTSDKRGEFWKSRDSNDPTGSTPSGFNVYGSMLIEFCAWLYWSTAPSSGEL